MISPLQVYDRTEVRGQIRQLLWNELGLLSTLSMEIAWLIPWIQVNIPGAQEAKTLHLFILLTMFALSVMVISRLLKSYTASPLIHQLVLLGLLFGGSLWFLDLSIYAGLGLRPDVILIQTLSSFSQGAGGIPRTLILLLITMFVWWRGIAVANKEALDYFGVRSRFRLGITVLALFGLLNSSHNNRYLIEAIPIFFTSGLLAIALGRTHRLGQSRAAFRLPFTESWFLGIVFLTLGTITFGMLGGAILRSPLALAIAKTVGELIIRGFQVVILVISPFFIWIPFLADKLIDLLETPEPIEPQVVDPDAGLGLSNLDLDLDQGAPILELPPVLVVLIVALAILLLAALIVRSARKRKRAQVPNFGDSGESLFKSRSLQARLQEVLEKAKEGIESVRRFGLGRRMLDATAIRWTYSQLLDLAARRGRERRPYETPLEFQEHLHKLFPLHMQEIALITEAYTEVRYGEFPEAKDIVALVRSAWVKVRSDAMGKVK